MTFLIIVIISLAVGGGIVFFLMEHQRRILDEQKREQEAEELRLQTVSRSLYAKEQTVNGERSRLDVAEAQFKSNFISFSELQTENSILKIDLRNLDVNIRKLRLDRDTLRDHQERLDEKIGELGRRYLKENTKWIGASLNSNNFSACEQRLLDVIDRCRGLGLEISDDEESELIGNLKFEFEKVVKAALAREEQARIKAQIRDEQLRDQEIERAQKQLDRERDVIAAALAQALAQAQNEYSVEVERLKAQLEAADSKQRAISQAQLTKSGHVYVISNIGSFGEGVFKVGMTRRLEPLDRVKELGDASVPFPFDVHMMIASDDAPSLENALHRQLHKQRVNKTNPKKEFFKAELTEIHDLVTEFHGVVEYVIDAEAIQFRQSLTMSDAEEEFIETVYAALEDDNQLDADEE
ncbi:MAG: GIY-YIG nuclease family protein [Planctomycetota bacterium]